MNNFRELREKMIKEQIIREGIIDEKIIKAMLEVERHKFVPIELVDYAYDDTPLPIGEGQTISQPFIVAYMSEQLDIHKEHKVLEIGTGSGYQTAILSILSKEVYSVEINCGLQERAKNLLKQLGYNNIYFKCDDGSKGWKDYAPFDRIIVTAAPNRAPKNLLSQLKIEGKMMIPIGDMVQYLFLFERTGKALKKTKLLPVQFVPFI